MSGETSIGGIIATLRLDTTDWDAHIAAAQAAAEQLGRTDPDVHIGVNSGEAISQLEAIRIATEHVSESMDDLGNRSTVAGQRGSHGMLSILKAVAPILPALVPLAGAAVGVGAAFGGMGAAGALAFLGLKRDMQEGTTDGQKLSAAIDGLKGGVQALETTASSGVLDGLLKGVDSVNQHLPALNAEIGHMATALGGTAYAAVDGILNLMVRLSPVFDMVGAAVEHVADEFDQWTKGAGASDFVSYLVQNLPTAGSLLANLATDVEHLVVAFAPLGSTVLSALSEVAAILKAIPVSVLTVLATGAATAYGAFLLWRGLPVILNGVSGALERVAYRMDSAVALNGAMAVSSGALKGALGGALAALAIGVTAWSLWREHQQKAEEQQRQLTDAIQQDNGAIGENTQKILANKIANDGLLQQSKELGISTSDLNAVLKQQPGALAAIHDQLMKTNSIRKTSNRLANETGNTSKVLDQRAAQYYGTLKQLHDQIGKGVSKSKAYKAALAAQEGATSKAAAATSAAALASMSATEADKDQKTRDRQAEPIDHDRDRQAARPIRLDHGL